MRWGMLALATLVLSGCTSQVPSPSKGTVDGVNYSDAFDSFEYIAGSNWTVLAGQWRLIDDTTARSQPHVMSGNSAGVDGLIIPKTGRYGDASYIVYARPASAGAGVAGLAFHVKDATSYNAVVLDWKAQRVRFEVVEDRFVVASEEATLALGAGWTQLSVTSRGDEVVAFVEGQEVLKSSTRRNPAGHAALLVKSGSTAAFDDFDVRLSA